MRLLDFLRDVGKHVTVNQMVARESVKARMASEHGISYTEFSYMLLQANDYAHLHEHEGCELQIGGSDQWGNILSGVDLIRRRRGTAVHALCWPLLTAADGSKLGKTTGARVWLDPELTSPYAFFQHWINTDDAEVGRMLAQFTLLPVAEIDGAPGGARRRPRPAAWPSGRWPGRSPSSSTAPRPGRPPRRPARSSSAATPARRPAAALAAVAREVPVARLEAGEDLAAGVPLGPVLQRAGLAVSQGDARRQLEQGGVSVNGEKAAAGPAPRAPPTSSTTAGCCSARARRAGRWSMLPAREVDTSRDPPIGCPSAPRRPRHRRRHRKGHPGTTAPLEAATAGRALPPAGADDAP